MTWSYLFLVNNSVFVNSLPPKGWLPKGVIRGCPECSNCQKVLARWDPEDACTYMLEEAPVFHPNEEEFRDTFKYIDSIRRQVESYGFCRIVPPPSWQLPCFLEESDIWQSYEVSAQIQRVNELQNHWSCAKTSSVHDSRETEKIKLAQFGNDCDANFVSTECLGAESCQPESVAQFTLIAFKRYADYFQQHYFSRDDETSDPKATATVYQEEWKPSEHDIEGEYWRIVERPTKEIEVLYGIDLDTRSFGCELPVTSNPEQATDLEQTSTSGWNLDYVSRLPVSLLSFEKSDSSVSLRPQLRFGMCFSSVPWTVEEHHLYKLYYLHLGAPRIWYGTSGCDPYDVEVVIKNHLPDYSEEHAGLHRKQGRQVSPATLKSEHIQVHRCIQHPREFVLFLPGAYQSGFDCGFNCSVSAAFAPLDWLPHGLNSIELYREQRRKTSISYDKVLLRAANEVVRTQWECLVKGKKTPKLMKWKETSGKDGILANVLRARIRMELRCREYLSSASQSRKMDKSFGAGDQKRECSSCCYDLYLSAASCPCSPTKFSCLKHAKHLCSCPWHDKVFLFRYMISELNMLLEAVEGKLSAIRSWIKEKLADAMYWEQPNEDGHGHTVDPSLIVETSDGGATFFDDKASTPKILSQEKAAPPGELSSANSKGKELATKMDCDLSDSSDDMSSVSSLECDIEAYIASLQSRKMINVPPVSHKEGEFVSNRTGENSIQQNASGSSVAVPTGNSVSEKDDASSSKLLSEAEASLPGDENLTNKLATGVGIDLSNLSDDSSLSSSSESDIDEYIERLHSQKRRKLSQACDKVGE